MREHEEHAVTVLISRRVKPGCEADFERVTQQLMEIASRATGYLGSHLVPPSEDPEEGDSLYHVVLAFESQAHIEEWQRSPERALGIAATAPYIEGKATHRNLSGLAMWFRGPKLLTPPRWKVAVITWLGICPTVYLLLNFAWDFLATWPLLPRVMVLTMVVVTVMTWVVAPVLTRTFKRWLVRPQQSRPLASTGS